MLTLTNKSWRALAAPLALAVVALAAAGLVACGGNNSMSGPGGSTTTASAPLVTNVGDAPMTTALSAQVTVSAVDALSSSGQVSILPAPRTIELGPLGGVREPLELDRLAAGTYTGVKVTVTAAKLVYVDPSTNQVVFDTKVALGGGGSSASASYTFTNPVTVSDNTGADLRLDFNLGQSFDLSGSTVTFTPVITAAMGDIDKGTPDDLDVRAAGIVTAISSTSVTLTMFDSGASMTFAINNETDFDDNATAASISTGAVVYVRGSVQGDGTYLAKEIDPADAGSKFGTQFNAAGAGRVIAVSSSGGQLSSFQLVTYTNFAAGEIGREVTVNVSGTTQYWFSNWASKAGVTAFDSTQIFPGQTVAYAGNSSDGGATVSALSVRLGQQTLYGTMASTASSDTEPVTFTLQLKPMTLFALLSGTADVTVTGGTEMRFGDSFESGISEVTNSDAIGIHGFVEQDVSGGVVSGSLLAGDLQGKVAVIIDDLISTGGTLLRAAEACRAHGATRVFAAAAHGLFIDGAKDLLASPLIDSIVVCDTVPPHRVPSEVAANRLTILGTSGALARAIAACHDG